MTKPTLNRGRSQPVVPSAPELVSRSSRLPYGVSGWVDLSSCHRYLGFGFVVYQRRFFEINWELRTVSYFNECRTDGDFVFGTGKKKEIKMSSIIRLQFPSTQASRQSGVPYSLGPFDIVTPDRIYTLIPSPPSPSSSMRRESKEQAKIRSYSANQSSSPSIFAFSSCCASPSSSSSQSLSTDQRQSLFNDQTTPPLCTMTTLSVRDFEQCIVDSSFSDPVGAGGTVAKLLLKRDVNDGGIPWEFECPLTLELMQDPVIATDGKTYERAAIEEWFLRSNGASVDGGKMISNKLVPNYRLKEEIAAYQKATHILRESNISTSRKSDHLINWW